MIRYLLLICFLTLSAMFYGQIPRPSEGKLVRYENFESSYVRARHVDVWLPSNYDEQKKYAVLYMHDGQMLWDASITWNKQEWGVDECVSRLMHEGKIRNCIVVGIYNGDERRHSEYFPQKPFESLSKHQRDSLYTLNRSENQALFDGKVQSNLYLKFMVKELKPFIDKLYPTLADRGNTFIAGSSMGGLISMYAICEYPEVFGGAACLSTHWTGIFTLENNPVPLAFFAYLKKNLPSPDSHKLYFDHGDATLDALYPPLQKEVDKIMLDKGFSDKQWISQFFAGEDHSEASWKKRLHIPLAFLLGE